MHSLSGARNKHKKFALKFLIELYMCLRSLYKEGWFKECVYTTLPLSRTIRIVAEK